MELAVTYCQVRESDIHSDYHASAMSKLMNSWVERGWSLRHFTTERIFQSEHYFVHTMVWERS